MANLGNAGSNQNYFQFHGSHYKFEKGVLLGLPISWPKKSINSLSYGMSEKTVYT